MVKLIRDFGISSLLDNVEKTGRKAGFLEPFLSIVFVSNPYFLHQRLQRILL